MLSSKLGRRTLHEIDQADHNLINRSVFLGILSVLLDTRRGRQKFWDARLSRSINALASKCSWRVFTCSGIKNDIWMQWRFNASVVCMSVYRVSNALQWYQVIYERRVSCFYVPTKLVNSCQHQFHFYTKHMSLIKAISWHFTLKSGSSVGEESMDIDMGHQSGSVRGSPGGYLLPSA